MKKLSFIALSFIAVGFWACSGQKDYKQTESGLSYLFYEKNKDRTPGIDEIAKVDLTYYYPQDSVIFSSVEYGPSMYLNIEPSEYPGDIYEAMQMMSKGDSASFQFDATQFFLTTLRTPELPEFVEEGQPIFVTVKLHDVFDKAEFEEYQAKQRQEFMEEQELAAMQEEGLLEQYLKDNQIDTQPEESGLIIIVEEQGQGSKVQPGQSVEIHYTGMVLDGTVFDSSEGREPISFQVGSGQVIRGWDEGITKLNVGSKARLIIPSYLAYGDQARGNIITPFSTLIFDIEIVSAK